MKMLARAGLGLSALLTCLAPGPAAAQSPDGMPVAAPGNFVPAQAFCTVGTDGKAICAPSIPTEARLTAPVSSAAGGTTELAGTVTASGCTPTVGACTFAAGVASIGPLTPQLGRDVRVVLKGTWAGTVQIGTSTAANACAPGTINLLTVGGIVWGSYTAAANEAVDTPTLVGIVYCATATITSGTLSFSVRQ